MISDESDYKGYFKILGFSPATGSSQVKCFLEIHYLHLCSEYQNNPEKLKLLNDAVEIFRDEEKLVQYVTDCSYKGRDVIDKMFS